MANASKRPEPPKDPQLSPPFWFLTLHESVLDGDTATTEQARKQLRKLGYEVNVVPAQQAAV